MEIKSVKDCEKQLLEDLKKLVSIPSVMDRTTAFEKAPFGIDVRNAFDEFKNIAIRLGFQVRDIDGYAIDAQIGEGDDYIGVLGHLDVVEARNQDGWESDPFTMKIEDGMLYGRGVNDDKGPLLAALYAAWLVKENGLKLKHPIRIIAGGAEETTWECMEYYFKKNPQPLWGFSPDGNFPIVNGEKGILQVRFVFPISDKVRIHSKHRLNFDCDDLTVEIDGKKSKYIGTKTLSRNPQRGNNAIFQFVKDMQDVEIHDQSLKCLVQMVKNQFLDDFYGEKSGLYAIDKEMGTTSVCLMSLESNQDVFELCVDVRYVKSVDEEELIKRLTEIAKEYTVDLEILKRKKLLYVPEDSELIQSLKRAYQQVTGEKAQVFTKGGASYARVLDRGVAFGATFEGEDPKPHMANEQMPVNSLMKACEIYYEALSELVLQ